MEQTERKPDAFLTTRWTVVVNAQAGSGPQAGAALSRLCQIYWRPVYHFIRHRGHTPHDAEDFTQGFFEALIEKDYLRSVDQRHGKFRSFLMAAAKHYLSDQYDRQRAWKRGGRVTQISLDTADAEETLAGELPNDLPPESAFDRVWAGTVIDRTFRRLQQLYEARGKLERFETLRPCLTGDGHRAYAELAQELDVSEDVVKTEVRRMRQAFRSLLREEVRETVSDARELESEIRYLGSLL